MPRGTRAIYGSERGTVVIRGIRRGDGMEGTEEEYGMGEDERERGGIGD